MRAQSKAGGSRLLAPRPSVAKVIARAQAASAETIAALAVIAARRGRVLTPGADGGGDGGSAAAESTSASSGLLESTDIAPDDAATTSHSAPTPRRRWPLRDVAPGGSSAGASGGACVAVAAAVVRHPAAAAVPTPCGMWPQASSDAPAAAATSMTSTGVAHWPAHSRAHGSDAPADENTVSLPPAAPPPRDVASRRPGPSPRWSSAVATPLSHLRAHARALRLEHRMFAKETQLMLAHSCAAVDDFAQQAHAALAAALSARDAGASSAHTAGLTRSRTTTSRLHFRYPTPQPWRRSARPSGSTSRR